MAKQPAFSFSVEVVLGIYLRLLGIKSWIFFDKKGHVVPCEVNQFANARTFL
jgi:hypothetical protein